MRKTILLTMLSVIFSCSSEKTDKKNNLETPQETKQEEENKLIDTRTYPGKIDVGNSIGKEFIQNDYLVSYEQGVLSACDFDMLSNLDSLDIIEDDEIKEKMKGYNDSIYYDNSYGDSTLIHEFRSENGLVKVSNWSDGNIGVKFISKDSYIIDTALVFNSVIKIGMDKKDFFIHFFVNVPDSIYTNTYRVAVAKNEMGEEYVNYYFEENKLSKITFEDY